MTRVEKNIAHTSPQKLLKFLMDNKDRALKVQEDCRNKIEKEKEAAKIGDSTSCKSGSKIFIRYLEDELKMNIQREFIYEGLIASIKNGDFVITKYDA